MIIVLYIMDSLRPDFLSCYGYRKETSPNIDLLARDGVLFTHAFAQCTWTRPSGASILSSTYPSVHGVMKSHDTFPEAVPTLARQLQIRGFKTIALSTMGNISPHFGFSQGFNQFVELYKEESLIRNRRKVKINNPQWEPHFQADVPILTSEDINTALFPLLEENRHEDAFFFIWSLDTHGPYFHRDPSLSRFFPSGKIWLSEAVERMHGEEERSALKRLYEDMIFYNDHHLGRLRDYLIKIDRYRDTLFILTGDHGEAFGEHGKNGHGKEPYDEQIRVPLIMKFPGSRFHGHVAGLAQHIDIGPTILGYVNAANAHGLLQGKSLLPVIQKKRDVNDYVFAEYQAREHTPRYTVLRTTQHKYIDITPGKLDRQRLISELRHRLIWRLAKPRILFDLTQDPGERTNVIKAERGLAERFQTLVDDFRLQNKKLSLDIRKGKVEDRESDEAVKRQLKALGYME